MRELKSRKLFRLYDQKGVLNLNDVCEMFEVQTESSTEIINPHKNTVCVLISVSIFMGIR